MIEARLGIAALTGALLLTGGAPLAARSAPPAATHGEGIVFHPSDLPYPFSEAAEVDGVLYLSGMIGVDAKGALVPGGVEPETRAIFTRIEATLARHGLGLGDVFKCTVMLADMADWPAFNAIYAGYFTKGRYPARSAFGANGLALGARVELECLAHKPARGNH
jgi:reactive intermediate/imine deaminase